MRKQVAFGLLICMMLLSLAAFGQETTGGIQGTVRDPQGAVVPGATIEVTSPALLGKRSQTSDAGGFYHFANLQPGLYSVTVASTGFSNQTQSNLQITVGALPTVNFTLQVSGVSQTVEVSAEAAAID